MAKGSRPKEMVQTDGASPSLALPSEPLPASMSRTMAEPQQPLFTDDELPPQAPGQARHGVGERIKWQEVFIPVHGLVRLRQDELAAFNHPSFQRLRLFFQLGQTYLVYPGATHARFEHAIGTVHTAQVMIDAIQRNAGVDPPDPGDFTGDWVLDIGLRPEEIAFVRLGALLHDVGHLPAGHTLEDELGLIGVHDELERLNLVFDRQEWFGLAPARTLREVVDETYAGFAKTAEFAADDGHQLTASEIVHALVAKDYPLETIRSATGFRLNVCRDIVGNTICADLLDYLHRDWYHIGKRREFDVRLLEYMEIRRRVSNPGDVRLVINLRGGHDIRLDAATSIMGLLESRYELSETALFHRTKLCATAMLERAIGEIAAALDTGYLSRLPELILEKSDFEMIRFLATEAEGILKGAEVPETAVADAVAGARDLLRRLSVRDLHAALYSAHEPQLPSVALSVQNRYSGPQSESNPRKRAQIGAANRLEAMRLLERDFGLRPGTLVMYCPPRRMNTKIAQVQVLVHEDVHTLDSFETEHRDQGITGGHLAAQKERFHRLWRVLIAIDPAERERLAGSGLLTTLTRAIEVCVLGMRPAGGSLDDGVRSLAQELASNPASPWHGKQVVPFEQVAARRGTWKVQYPTGAPRIADCLE